MQERLLGRLDREPGTELTSQAFQCSLERKEVGRLAATAPGLRRKRADREGADPVRLGIRRRPLPSEAPEQRTGGPISGLRAGIQARRRRAR